MDKNDPTYALGRATEEHERLMEQAAIIRPMTERLFRSAGIAPGMRVLEVGSGAGDVAFLAAEIVGANGEVVGVDLDGAALAKARTRAKLLGLENITFIEGDVRGANLGGEFDAAVGRLVLMYLADPSAGLAAIAGRVRSGGALAFQEMDMDLDNPFSYPGESLMSETSRIFIRTFAGAGVHVRMGRKLLQTFVRAGLGFPSLMEEVVVGGGPDFRAYSWLANTVRSLAPLTEKLGIATVASLGLDSLADRLRDDAVAREVMVWAPSFVGAYARVR